MQGSFPAAKTKHCVRTDLQVPTPVDSVAEGPAEVCWHGCNVALAARAAGTAIMNGARSVTAKSCMTMQAGKCIATRAHMCPVVLHLCLQSQ